MFTIVNTPRGRKWTDMVTSTGCNRSQPRHDELPLDEFYAAIERSDSLELVPWEELRERLSGGDRWTVTEEIAPLKLCGDCGRVVSVPCEACEATGQEGGDSC